MPADKKYIRRMSARHLYMRQLRELQDEVVGAIQRDEFKIKDMKEHIDRNSPKPIATSTIARFVNYGRGGSYKVYSRGPASTTLFAILNASGFEFNIRRIKNK